MALIGAFCLLRSYVNFDFGMVIVFVTGLALLLLYRQKKAVWALFAGGYISFIGLMMFMSWANIGLKSNAIAGMFFIVPGILFMVLYFNKHKIGLLIPSCLLLWSGTFFILINIFQFGARMKFGALLTCLGCGFCTSYTIGKSHLSPRVRNLGAILILAGCLIAVISDQ